VSQHVYLVERPAKPALLIDLLSKPEFARTLVFTRTKRGADRVTERLEAAGIPAAAIHGNKSQSQRERALLSFRQGRTRILVATDIAARGIDVDGITHVVNFDLPEVAEAYVHRIGRTARAGAAGIAISFCDHEERGYLRDIERLTRQTLPVTDRRGKVPAGSHEVMARVDGETRGHQGRGHGQPSRGHSDNRNHGDNRNRNDGRGHGEARPQADARARNDGRGHSDGRGQKEGRGHGEGRAGPRSARPAGGKNRRPGRPSYQPNHGRTAVGD